MHTFWIGTGWKMNKTVAEARGYIATLLSLLPDTTDDVRLFVVPSFTALSAVREAIGGGAVLLGAQNMHWAEAGAYTGEISIGMLLDSGVELIELGHSERRRMFGETDTAINRKVKLALKHGLRPLVCVGDSAAERDANASAETVVRQVKLALSGVSPGDIGRCLVAYEPIWAIGDSGVAASPQHVRDTHLEIQRALRELTPHRVPVLYGGSVDRSNAAQLAGEPSVDGLFIGRAGWQPEGFASLIADVVTVRIGDAGVRRREGDERPESARAGHL